MIKSLAALLFLLPFAPQEEITPLARKPVRVDLPPKSTLADICAAASKNSGVQIEATPGTEVLVGGVSGSGSVAELLLYLESETGLHSSLKSGVVTLGAAGGSESMRRTLAALSLGENVGSTNLAFGAATANIKITLDCPEDSRVADIAAYFGHVTGLKIRLQDESVGELKLAQCRILDGRAAFVFQSVLRSADLVHGIRRGELLIGMPEWVRDQLSPGIADPLGGCEAPSDNELETRGLVRRLTDMKMEVRFPKTPLADVLKFASDVTGFGVIQAEPPPAGATVTLEEDLPALQVINHALGQCKWALYVEGTTLVCGSPEGLRRRIYGPDEATKDAAREVVATDLVQFLTPSAVERSKQKVRIPAGAGPVGRARALLEQAGLRWLVVDKVAVLHSRLDVKEEAERWKEILPGNLEASAKRAAAGLTEIAKQGEALQPKLDEMQRKIEAGTAELRKGMEEFDAALQKEVQAASEKNEAAIAALKLEDALKERDMKHDALDGLEMVEKSLRSKLEEKWGQKIFDLENSVKKLEEGKAAAKDIENAKSELDKARKDAKKEQDAHEEEFAKQRIDLRKAEEDLRQKIDQLRNQEFELKVDLDKSRAAVERRQSERGQKFDLDREKLVKRVEKEFGETVLARNNLQLQKESIEDIGRRAKGRLESASRGELPLPALVTISMSDGRALENVILHSSNVGSFTVEKAGWRFRVVELPDKVTIRATIDGKPRDIDPVTLKVK